MKTNTNLFLNLGISSVDNEEKLRMLMLNRVALMSTLFSIVYFFIFFNLHLFIDAFVMLFFMLVFGLVMFLTAHNHFNKARISYMVSSNLGLLYFSISLGFDSGIHLFTCLAPVFVFSIFSLDNIKGISLSLLLYVVNYFAMIYFADTTLLYTTAVLLMTLLQTVIVYYLKQRSDKLIKDLEEQNRLLDIKLKSIEQFSKIVNHEIRGPLATILGLVELYKLGKKEEIAQYIGIAGEDLECKVKKLNNVLDNE